MRYASECPEVTITNVDRATAASASGTTSSNTITVVGEAPVTESFMRRVSVWASTSVPMPAPSVASCSLR